MLVGWEKMNHARKLILINILPPPLPPPPTYLKRNMHLQQVELRAHIDNLAEDLRRISDCRVVPIDLDPYVKRLLNTRRRISNVATLLQSVQERVNKVNYYVNRDKAKKNQMIKASTTKALDRAATAAANASSSSPDSAPSVSTKDPVDGEKTDSDVDGQKKEEAQEQLEGAMAPSSVDD